MKLYKSILYIVLISVSIVSCKNDAKNSTSISEIEPVIEEKTPVKQVNEKLKKKKANSVISKMMFTEESQSFVRYLISADLIDLLSEDDGPFTILAPSNDAFDTLTAEQLNTLQDYRKKEFLESVFKTHIINGNMDSAQLVQGIKKNSGTITISTLSGSELSFSMKGSDIVVTDENGAKAKIGKSDIVGSNGVIHILDKVLVLN